MTQIAAVLTWPNHLARSAAPITHRTRPTVRMGVSESPKDARPSTTSTAATIAWVVIFPVLSSQPFRYIAYTPSSIPMTEAASSQGAQ